MLQWRHARVDVTNASNASMPDLSSAHRRHRPGTANRHAMRPTPSCPVRPTLPSRARPACKAEGRPWANRVGFDGANWANGADGVPNSKDIIYNIHINPRTSFVWAQDPAISTGYDVLSQAPDGFYIPTANGVSGTGLLTLTGAGRVLSSTHRWRLFVRALSAVLSGIRITLGTDRVLWATARQLPVRIRLHVD